ncbi:MAG TPA: gliding motility protein GldC [Ignavibacteriaceae bacterium]|nr:gliding motility protein GldC [Ignavibacteriaceae bacterium]
MPDNKTGEIFFKVSFDENNVPDKISWDATDSSVDKAKECKAFLISIWDKDEQTTLGLDLWTKDMLHDDMNVFYHQTLLKMADTFSRATKNQDVAEMISEFADKFAHKLKLFDDDGGHEHHGHQHPHDH